MDFMFIDLLKRNKDFTQKYIVLNFFEIIKLLIGRPILSNF